MLIPPEQRSASLAPVFLGFWALCHLALNAGLYIPFPSFWQFNNARLAESLLVFSLAALAVGRIAAPQRRTAYLLLTLSAVLGASTALSLLPGVAALWLGFYAIWVLAILALAHSLQPDLERQTRQVAWVLTAAAGLFGLRFVADYGIALSTGQWHSWELWWARYENIRTFSQLLVWTLPLAPAVLWSLRTLPRRGWLLAGLLWVLWGSLLFWSGTRAIVVAFAAAAVTGWVLGGPALRAYLRRFAVYLLLCLSLFGVMKGLSLHSLGPVQATFDLTRGVSSPGRMMLWEDALNMVQAHPLLGVGPYHFAWHSRREGAGPHSWLFESLAEYGIPLTLLFIALLLRAFWRMRQQVLLRPAQANPWPAALLLTLAAVGVDGLFEGVQIPPYSRVVGLMVLALAVAWFCGPLDARAQPTSTAARRAWRGLLALTVAGILSLYAHEFYQRWPCLTESMDETLKRPEEIQQRQPRFWIAGRSLFIPSCRAESGEPTE
jgi:O-antigen ligase